ncbi:hypothetical protein LJ207_06385 [Halanaerobium sp. Z-7514]|uniref:Inverse autotransporter beta-domain domain-containing protein n=1 Tax=Halanaerobium polyolivorans TaxID=2886943 RepID=A0AAW4WZI4_9FIRM|nr:hypothetical protein [Halanaerobium polyolivorans]MCC3144945.1 hypothetical protein [Halanaerobium polyolivorans]
MSFKKSIIFSLIILFFIFAVITTVSAEEFQRAPRFNLRGITGDDFIGQAGILYPFRNKENSIWYTDLRYRMSEDDVDEWNLGLGYRYKLDNVDINITGNDITSSEIGIGIQPAQMLSSLDNPNTNEININISDNRLNNITNIGIGLSIPNEDILTLQGNEFSDMDTGVVLPLFLENDDLENQIKADNEFNEIDEGNEVKFLSLDK